MNHKVSSQVIHFWNCVHWYVEQEYPDYFKYFIPDELLPWNNKSTKKYEQAQEQFNKIWDIAYGYYLGGNNAEDTAGFMVDYLKGQKNG
jgi:hypothetical protein